MLFTDPEGDGSTLDMLTLPRDGRKIRSIRGRRMGMIFQEPMTSFSPLHTVGNQIEEALRIHTVLSKPERRDRCEEMLGMVGFQDPRKVFDMYPFELSGGMRQRAMIAMALICGPALLIADEPTTALDVTIQAQILKLMRDLQQQFNMAILLITHDLGVVANIADEVVVIYQGEIMEAGPVEPLFRKPQHPYLKGLMQAVPHFGMKPGDRLKPLRDIAVDHNSLVHGVGAPQGCGDRARGAADGARPEQDLCHAEVRLGVRRARRRPCPRWMGSASTSGGASVSGWWARAAAARRRSARS